MSGLKAVVLEKNGTLLTVLSSDGTFQKLRHKGIVEIGEEINIPAVRQIPIWRIGASVAVIFVMVFMGVFGWNAFQPRTAVAMLSLDINPSLQLTLDRKGRVLELESLNPDAEQLLSGLPLKGEPWEEALAQIIEQSVDMHYLSSEHTWVLVGYSLMKSDLDLPLKEINIGEIVRQVEGAAVEKGISPKVAVYELTAEEQVQAQETGLTLGEYALVNTAQKAGVKIEPETIKKTDERVRLLEKPEIQEQMKKENRIKVNEKKALPSSTDPKAEKGQEHEPDKAVQPSRGFENNSGNNEQKTSDEKNAVSPLSQSDKQDGDSSRDKDQDEYEKSQDKDKDKDKNKDEDKDKDEDKKEDKDNSSKDDDDNGDRDGQR